MKHTMYLAGLMAALIPFAFVGCASKPEAELQLAEKVMEDAKAQYDSDLAPYFSPEQIQDMRDYLDWERGKQDWDEAQTLIEMGRYSEAKLLLNRAAENFNKVINAAREKRDGLIREVGELQGKIENQYNTLKQDSHAGKLPRKFLKKLDEAFPWIDEKIAEMKGAVEEKQYERARMAGKYALGRIYELQTELEDNAKHKS